MMSWGGVMGWGVIEEGWRKGPWTAEEDRLLIEYVRLHGEGRWNSVARLAGLRRNGKSCRLRWVNYLRPDLKRGQITPHEESVILELHARWGNRWSTIARSLPGRTDNEIKNYWRTHFKKKTTKISGDNTSDKAKTNRLLKRQQFHQQQHEQQQVIMDNNHQLDMNRIMFLLDDENENSDRGGLYVPHQPRQEFMNIYNNSNQYYNYGVSGSSTSGCVSGETSNEDILWDGLWNLDDFVGVGGTCATSKASLHNNNLLAPFC